ncbi:TPA: hypothetical protein ACH3X2_003707 [Trebouxia sp. C0005]
MLLAVQQCFKEQVGPCFMLCVHVCLLYIAAAACCFPLPASTALRHSCKLSIAVTPSKSLPGYLLCHIFGWLRLQPQCCVLFCQRIATAFSHWCLWLLLQNAQQIQQLRSELQDAQQATNQAQVEKAGAVAETDSAIAEGVHLTQQRDMWENMVEDLKKENVILKAEAQRANFKLHDMEVRSKELQREYQDVHGFIATLEREHHSKMAECQAQTVNLQGMVEELRSEAAADMDHKVEVVHVRGMLDNKQQEIEALERRLAHSQTCLANSERRAQAWQHELSYTQERLQTLECEHHGKTAECQAQIVNLQGVVEELRSEAAADMDHNREVVHVRGMLDAKQQEVEALEHRLAHSQTRLANSERRAQVWQHEVSYTQERLQSKVEQLEATMECTIDELSQMVTRCREAECKYHKSEETLATLRMAVDTTLDRRSKVFDDIFDTMFKARLDLEGENELLKHNHAALEQQLEKLQRELDISSQWRLEAMGELDEVTDELTLIKETLHAQGFRLSNGDPFVVSHPPLGFDE